MRSLIGLLVGMSLVGAGCQGTSGASVNDEFALKEKCSKMQYGWKKEKGYGVDDRSTCYSKTRNTCMAFNVWYTSDKTQWGYDGTDILTNESVLDSKWYPVRNEAVNALIKDKSDLGCM